MSARHSTLRRGQPKKRVVSWIVAKFVTGKHVMPRGAKPLGETTTGAAIDQESHFPTVTSSSDSFAITAWA